MSVFKQQFSVFKQHFTFFNTFFHSHVFLQKLLNNNFQFLNTCTKRALYYLEKRLCLTTLFFFFKINIVKFKVNLRYKICSNLSYLKFWGEKLNLPNDVFNFEFWCMSCLCCLFMQEWIDFLRQAESETCSKIFWINVISFDSTGSPIFPFYFIYLFIYIIHFQLYV